MGIQFTRSGAGKQVRLFHIQPAVRKTLDADKKHDVKWKKSALLGLSEKLLVNWSFSQRSLLG